jgi:hypothetical protein
MISLSATTSSWAWTRFRLQMRASGWRGTSTSATAWPTNTDTRCMMGRWRTSARTFSELFFQLLNAFFHVLKNFIVITQNDIVRKLLLYFYNFVNVNRPNAWGKEEEEKKRAWSIQTQFAHEIQNRQFQGGIFHVRLSNPLPHCSQRHRPPLWSTIPFPSHLTV